jgi:hypothetical protein
MGPVRAPFPSEEAFVKPQMNNKPVAILANVAVCPMMTADDHDGKPGGNIACIPRSTGNGAAGDLKRFSDYR